MARCQRLAPVLLALLATQPSAAQAQSGASPSFTTEQAEAGGAAYARECATCHGDALEGVGITPGLAGDRFAVRWGGQRLDRLWTEMQRMPPTSPGELAVQTYVEIAAYLLRANGVAAGGRPLAAGPEDWAGFVVPAGRETEAATGALADAGRRTQLLSGLRPVTAEMLADPPPEDWLGWRRTYDSQGYSPLDQITTRNVADLGVAWSLGLAPGANNPMPLVHDGVMFLFTFPDTVLALDATTGALLWRHQYDPAVPSSKKMGIALHGNRVLVPTSDLHVLALDARTGEVVWDHPIAIDTPAWAGGNAARSREPRQNHGGYQLRAAPWIAGDTVIQGITAINVPGGGFVVALDAETGEESWRFHTVARPGELGGDSWNDLPLEARSGGSVWNQGSYDPELDLLFFGSGPTYDTGPLLEEVGRDGVTTDALFTNATVALRRATGELVWYYQHLANDQWDLDWAFEREIATLRVDGVLRKVVMTAGKMAILDVLDAATGQYLFSYDAGLQNVVSATDPVSGAKTIAPEAVPSLTETRLVCPNHYGIRSWPGLSMNPATSRLFLPLTAGCMLAGPEGYGLLSSGVRLQVALHPSSTDGTMGRLQALDLETRELVWEHREGAPFISAALATGGGLLFVGDLNRSFRAFDQATGEVLWETALDDVPSSSVITYAVDGRQYLAVVVGQTNNHVDDWTRVFTGPGRDAGLRVNDDPKGGPAILVFAL